MWWGCVPHSMTKFSYNLHTLERRTRVNSTNPLILLTWKSLGTVIREGKRPEYSGLRNEWLAIKTVNTE